MIITLTIHKKTSDVVSCEVNIEHCGKSNESN